MHDRLGYWVLSALTCLVPAAARAQATPGGSGLAPAVAEAEGAATEVQADQVPADNSDGADGVTERGPAADSVEDRAEKRAAEPLPKQSAAISVPVVAEPAAVEPTTEGSGAKNAAKAKKTKKPWKKRPKLRIGGYVHALYALQDRPDAPNNEFRIRSARAQLDWKQGELLQVQLEFELAHEQEAITAWAPLRDGFVRVKPMDELRIRMGQFKKPFGRLALIGRQKLILAERGISNSWIIEDLGYGDRDVGLQVDGRFGKHPRVNYAVGVFNGSGRNQREVNNVKDFSARVDVDATPWLNLGLNGSHKRFARDTFADIADAADPRPASGTMGGADFGIDYQGLTVIGEGMYGQNYLSRDGADSWSALVLGAYKIPLVPTWKLALEPLAKGEILKAEHAIVRAHVLSGTLGANLHVGKYFRLMVQGETVRTSRNALPLWQDERRLFLLAALRAR